MSDSVYAGVLERINTASSRGAVKGSWWISRAAPIIAEALADLGGQLADLRAQVGTETEVAKRRYASAMDGRERAFWAGYGACAEALADQLAQPRRLKAERQGANQ